MILVFGTICLDRVRRVPAIPTKGRYVEIMDERVLLGGEAANTAFALKSWGAEVLLAGNSLGEGESAVILRELLQGKGLSLDHVPDSGGRTPVCDVYVTPDGDRTMIGMGFSELGKSQFFSELPIRPGEWFTADPNFGEAAREAARQAHAGGMKLYLMDFIRPKDPVFPGSFWQSSTDWAGHPGNIQKNVEWVKRWVDKHGCFTILSDGPNGLVAGSPEHRVQAYAPFPCPKVVDSTGAGDMLRAGVLFGLDRGLPIEECLLLGMAAGSLKCRTLGATTKVPKMTELLALVESRAAHSAGPPASRA